MLPGIQNSPDSLNEYISRENEIALSKKKLNFARKQPTAEAIKPKPSERIVESHAKYSQQ